MGLSFDQIMTHELQVKMVLRLVREVVITICHRITRATTARAPFRLHVNVSRTVVILAEVGCRTANVQTTHEGIVEERIIAIV